MLFLLLLNNILGNKHSVLARRWVKASQQTSTQISRQQGTLGDMTGHTSAQWGLGCKREIKLAN